MPPRSTVADRREGFERAAIGGRRRCQTTRIADPLAALCAATSGNVAIPANSTRNEDGKKTFENASAGWPTALSAAGMKLD